METQNKKWFTLVELIIVITILAILATIWFISYQSYTKDSRDANRITSLKTIRDALVVQKTKKSVYPMPDDYLSIFWNWVAVSYQWYVWAWVNQAIRASETKDPADWTYYTYELSADQTKFQLAWFLDSDPSKLVSFNNIPYANAVDYTSRYLYTVWDKIGVLLDA